MILIAIGFMLGVGASLLLGACMNCMPQKATPKRSTK